MFFNLVDDQRQNSVYVRIVNHNETGIVRDQAGVASIHEMECLGEIELCFETSE